MLLKRIKIWNSFRHVFLLPQLKALAFLQVARSVWSLCQDFTISDNTDFISPWQQEIINQENF